MKAIDVLIIGGGIAGMSLAGRLSRRARVTLLEQETMLAYHTTARSAALYSEMYGNAAVRRLTCQSRPFFERPPTGFCERPLLSPRPSLFVARPEYAAKLAHELARGAGVARPLSLAELHARMPALRKDIFAAAGEEPGSADIDVHGLYEGFRKMALHQGASIRVGCEVLGITPRSRDWVVITREEHIQAPVVVNAAGAWAGVLGATAGLGDRGLTPLRRTAVLIDPPDGVEVSNWCHVDDVGGDFYFKPDAGLILASPVDETPSPPCDAQPEDIDVATIASRIEEVTTLQVRRIRRKWAGLRTFTPDRTPLFEFDAQAAGFFWLAGQGGFGVQTAPAVSALAEERIVQYLA